MAAFRVAYDKKVGRKTGNWIQAVGCSQSLYELADIDATLDEVSNMSKTIVWVKVSTNISTQIYHIYVLWVQDCKITEENSFWRVLSVPRT